MNTHIRISQFVTSLLTSCEQVVFAWLVTSCQQVWNKSLTACNKLVIIRHITRLFWQGCHNHDITILLQPCVVNLVAILFYHDYIRLVRAIYLVTSCWQLVLNNSWRNSLQLVYELVRTCPFLCHSFCADDYILKISTIIFHMRNLSLCWFTCWKWVFMLTKCIWKIMCQLFDWDWARGDHND